MKEKATENNVVDVAFHSLGLFFLIVSVPGNDLIGAMGNML